MWTWWKTRQSVRRASERILAARRHAEGVMAREWQLEAGAAHAAGEAVLNWCREALAGTRRPYGIDEFDLALAYSSADGVASQLFRLRPGDLYTEETVARLSAFLTPAESGCSRIAAALFPWGETIHRHLPQR